MMQQPGPQGYFFDPSSAIGCNYQLSSRAWSAIMVYRVIPTTTRSRDTSSTNSISCKDREGE
jgi:hypothetical protein